MAPIKSPGARRDAHALLSLVDDPGMLDMLRRTGPVFAHRVHAGFPSSADDYVEAHLSLDEHLINNKEATFFLRVTGDSMSGAGILDGDLLVVDRSVTAVPGHVVIAVLNGELAVKRLVRVDNGYALRAAHADYPDIIVGADQELQVWGVVRFSIHTVAP